jgi:hypothetical protein
MIPTTGPKISSWAMQLGAAGDEPGPLGLARLDVAQHRLLGVRADERAHVGLGLHAVADLERGRPRGDRLAEAVEHVLLDDDPAGGRALLSRGQHGPGDRQLGGLLDVRVLEDHDRVLAPHLELELRAALRGLDGEAGPHVVGAREADGLDPRVRDQGLPDL